MNELKKAKIDIAVLLVFFARPDTFAQVFEQIKDVRPSKLFLYQDGPRDSNASDIINIKKCREIAEQIDWECEVHRLYQEKNVGCDPSGFIAQTWAFSLVDKCVVIEDDIVPSKTFFTFCKHMLDKYENDERITMIGGFNFDEVTPDIEEDYFFTSCTTSWGWASWRRVVSKWDKTYNVLDSEQYYRMLKNLIKQKGHMKNFITFAMNHKNSGKPFFESIMMINHYLNSGLMILPKKNMVNNIGTSENATHFSSDLRILPKGYRKIFTMQRYEMDEPYNHPKYIIDHVDYQKRSYRIKAWGHPFVKAFRLLESSLYMLRYGKGKSMVINLTDKIRKLIKKLSY